MAGSVTPDDARWRDAAALLGLDLFNAKERKVPLEKGKRAHEMRGRVDERVVCIRYGLQSPADGIMVMHVRLAEPLLLGLVARTFSPPKNARGSYEWGILETVVEGIERQRVVTMFEETRPGRELGGLLRELGSHGWVELRDADLRSQSQIHADSAAGYVDLIRMATRIVVLAEAARAELGPADWEADLRTRFEAAASELRLAGNAGRFALTGVVRSSPVSLRLEASERYALLCKVRLPVALPPGSCITRRSGVWSKLAALAGIDRPTDDGSFNAAFEVRGAYRRRLTRDATTGLLELSREGNVRVEHDAITYRTATLNVNASRVLLDLAALAERIADQSGASPGVVPYR